jgi:hypothetical protein
MRPVPTSDSTLVRMAMDAPLSRRVTRKTTCADVPSNDVRRRSR